MKKIKTEAIKDWTSRGRPTRSSALRAGIIGLLRDEWIGEENNYWRSFRELALDLSAWAEGEIDEKAVRREVHRLAAVGVLERREMFNDTDRFAGSGYFLTLLYKADSALGMASAPYEWVAALRATYGAKKKEAT